MMKDKPLKKYSYADLEILTHKRIDPYYYQRNFIDHVNKIRTQFKSFFSLGDIFLVLDGTHDSVMTQDSQNETFNVPFLRAQDIGHCHLDEFGAFLRQEDHDKKCKRSKIQHGDVLINIMASTGDACFYSEIFPSTANANRAVGILRPIQKTLTSSQRRFFVALLASSVGSLELQRNLKGSIQQRLNLEDIENVQLPEVDCEVQTYIGNKVWQAERLRDRSRELDKGINTIYDRKLHELGYQKVLPKKAYRITLKERLDPLYYNPQFTGVFDSDWFIEKSEPLINFIQNGSYGVLPDSKTYGTGAEILLTASDLRNCNFDFNVGISVPISQVSNKGLVKLNDILLEIKGAIDQCSVASSLAEGKYVNGSVFRFSTQNIETGYLAFYLKSHIKQKYCSREAVNNIIQYLNLECIKSLPVLRLEATTENQISVDFLLSRDLLMFGHLLTTAAKLLVEALIEGKISEADLKAAQEGLEKSDITLDREILARLTRKGIDCPNEPPLCPDLDALYATIASLDETKQPKEANHGNGQAAKVYHLHGTPLALASEAPETSYAKPKEVPE
jgi:type I restriction enzyme, S subunit